MSIREQKLLKWVLLSNSLYVLLLVLFRPQGINFFKIAVTSILLASMLGLCLIAIQKWNRLNQIPKGIRGVYYALLLYGVIVIVRGFSLSLQDWVTNFGNVYMGLAWMTPLALVYGIKIDNWNIILKVVYFVIQLTIIVFLGTILVIEDYVKWAWLLRPLHLLLLLRYYKGRPLRLAVLFIAIIVYLIIAQIVQQRLDFLFLGLTLGFFFLDILFGLKIRKGYLKYIYVGMAVILLFVFTVGYEELSLMVSSIISFQDSRVFLFNELFTELSTTNEMLFGRGSLGTYYSDFFERTRRYYEIMGRVGWAGDVPDRITIEVGYLQMILKGGILLLLLNIIIYFYAIYVSIFRSNNKFVTRLGYFILIITSLSIVSFRPAFSPTFLILWAAIGTVLNKQNRAMTDAEIKDLISF